MRLAMRLMVASATLALAPMLLAQQNKPPEVDSADAALAERLAQMGQFAVAGKRIVPETIRQSAALLECAAKLNPNEPRFLHLLTEAYLQLGGDEGRDGAISSLTRYLKLQPADLVAQMQLIDLHYGKIDTADRARAYLDQIVNTPNVAAQVKAHVAVLASKLATERAESSAARAYVDQALKLNPLSLEALQLKYAALSDEATVVQRIGILLDMVRSNPTQPAVMMELAGQLSHAGLVDPALNWYQQAFGVLRMLNARPTFNDSTAFAAELVIADQVRAADPVLRDILQADPTNVEAALLLLTTEQRSGDAGRIATATTAARDAINARLSRVSDQLNQRQPAAGAAAAAPDIAADLQKLQQETGRGFVDAYAASLADLAWLDIYFAKKPADAQAAMQSLRQLVPADAGILARLEGWGYLVEDRKNEAKVKLSAVADRDPLSALGLLKVDNDPQVIATEGKKLLLANADGVVGALLIEALRPNFGLMPAGPDAPAIREKLAAFPRDWMNILDPSRVKDFYSLRAEPKKISHEFGEPMIATVTISNVGNFDITVGPDGAIKPDLWFDAQVRGVNNQQFNGVAIDRIGQSTLLKPKESISIDVRVDQDGLLGAMQQDPLVIMPLFFSVLTNPSTQANGIAPGPCGLRAQFNQVLNRKATQLSPNAIQEAANQLQTGKGSVQITATDRLNMFANLLHNQPDPVMAKKADEIGDIIRKAKGDPNSSVAAYALMTSAMHSDAPIRDGIFRQMLSDGDLAQKILATVSIHLGVAPEARKEMLAGLIEDEKVDPLVRKLAKSVIEVAALPAPTTQSAGGELAPAPLERDKPPTLQMP